MMSLKWMLGAALATALLELSAVESGGSFGLDNTASGRPGGYRVSGGSKGSRRYDKENLLWQFTVAIRSLLALRGESAVREAARTSHSRIRKV
jgi:hypothetical protein